MYIPLDLSNIVLDYTGDFDTEAKQIINGAVILPDPVRQTEKGIPVVDSGKDF